MVVDFASADFFAGGIAAVDLLSGGTVSGLASAAGLFAGGTVDALGGGSVVGSFDAKSAGDFASIALPSSAVVSASSAFAGTEGGAGAAGASDGSWEIPSIVCVPSLAGFATSWTGGPSGNSRAR